MTDHTDHTDEQRDETPEPTADGGVEVRKPDADPGGQADERPPRPDPLDVRVEHVPETLRRFDNWVCWTYEYDDDRDEWTKLPVDAETGRLAKTNDPSTWSAFGAAVAFHREGDRRTDGVGFVLDDTDRFVGVDLDDCRDPETGERDAWADDVIDRLDTYAEVSPSGTGLRAFAIGALPEGRRKRGVDGAEGDIEMYDDGRYLTVTGHRVGEETDVAAVAEDIADVHAEYLADDPEPEPEPEPVEDTGAAPADLGDPDRDRDHGRETGAATAPKSDADLTDDEVLEKAKNAKNGAKFRRLWNGRTTGYDSHSEADMALCTLLAFWTGRNRRQMDRLFRDSGLMREKWDADRGAQTYGERTIEEAQGAVSACYDPSHGDGTDATTAAADGGVSDVTWDNVRAMFDDSDVPRGAALKAAADLLCNRETFATMDDTEDIYRYNPETGIYEPDGEQYVGSVLESGLGEHYGGSERREVLTRIRDRTWTERDTFGGSRADPKVCVGNGVLDIETLELYDHSPDREFIRRIPWDWPEDDGVEPEAFDEFLGDVVGDEESKQTIYEVLGLAIHPGYLKAGFLLLYGDGRNGKSTLLEALERVLDPANVSSRTMRDLVSDNHAKASLYGKMANICGETGSDKLPNTAALKELTGGDSVTANPKNKQPFTFHNEAVLMFLANDPPEIDDDSTALARRMLLVNCPNEFTPEGEPGPDLRPKQELLADIASPEECQAILRRAVEAVRRIRETGSFGHSQSVEEVRERYNRISDPVYAFQETAVEQTSDGWVPTSDLYGAYKAWCRENDAPVKDKGVFIKKLQKHVRMERQRRSHGDGRPRGYAGITLTREAAALIVDEDTTIDEW